MDHETWKPIPDHPDYEASDRGRVRSLDRVRNGQRYPGKVLSPWSPKDGYPVVRLRTAGRATYLRVHSLVLAAFEGPRPDGCVARHLDGDASNNQRRNLCWGTQADNITDKSCHGTVCRGSQCGNSKLTEAAVLRIRAAIAAGLPITTIARAHRVTPATVRDIKRGHTWAWLS